MAERHVLQVYVGSLSRLYEALSIEASKITTADEIVECICEKLGLHDGAGFYELAEVMGNEGGQDCKERRIGHQDCPVALQLLWPKKNNKAGGHPDFKFCLRRKLMGNFWSLSMSDSNDSQLIRDYFLRFLYQPRNCEYSDLCQLPDLTEQTLLENLKVFNVGWTQHCVNDSSSSSNINNIIKYIVLAASNYILDAMPKQSKRPSKITHFESIASLIL